MSIQNPDARYLYEVAVLGGHTLPPEIAQAKESADVAFEELQKIAEEKGLFVPRDDRAENVVTAMFDMLVRAQGLDLQAMVYTLRTVDEASQ